MRLAVALLAVAIPVQAGIIKGVVLEHASSRPLARAVVRLTQVPGSGDTRGKPLVTKAGRAGQFVFGALSPGTYLLQAVREGFFPGAYGQRLPTGWGTSIEVTANSTFFAQLRLRHWGALTGRVLDENGVGMAGIPVLAYRARLPLRSAGDAKSDDRGVFRIPGLDPGKYWARSGAHEFDDGSRWLPTYSSQGREVSEALTHRVAVDVDTTNVDITPDPGRLFNIAGLVVCDTPGPVTVTLSSETGRRRTDASCGGGCRFEGVAPGRYEVFATLRNGDAAGFTELSLGRDMEAANVPVRRLPTIAIEVRWADSKDVADIPVKLIGRRKDLSETEDGREIDGPRATLAPGHWEFRAVAPGGQYVESIVQRYGQAPRRSKAEDTSDWYQVFIPTGDWSRLTITVSDQAGELAGRVMAKSKPVPGAPVFLWPVAVSARRSLPSPVLQRLSDTEGRFHFDGLPPGDYRLLATFDVREIDAELIELSRAVSAHVEAFQTTSIEVPVWIAPW